MQFLSAAMKGGIKWGEGGGRVSQSSSIGDDSHVLKILTEPLCYRVCLSLEGGKYRIGMLLT